MKGKEKSQVTGYKGGKKKRIEPFMLAIKIKCCCCYLVF